MGQTIVEKIAQSHRVEGPKGRPLRTGDFVTLRPDHVMTHDNTAAVMKKFRALGANGLADPRQPVFALDHDIQNQSETNLAKYRSIEAFARAHRVDFYPAGTGIGHQIMVENGYVVPGALVVASDSHANMYGALGALGTPVVRTDAAAIWASGEFWWQIPRTVQVVLTGELRPGVTGKDVIIVLAGLYDDEVLNAVVELAGEGVASLSIDARFSIANMSTEWGALAAWFPVDAVTIEYLRARREVLLARGIERFSHDDLEAWESSPPQPDADATYAGRIELDLGQVTPHVSGPDTVQIMRRVSDFEADRLPIQKAYLVSCVNSRLEDLRAAAAVLEGQKVASGVELYVAAASREVQQQAEAQQIWQTLLEAGARPLPPGCGPCIGLGVGLLEPGEVGISATNRNFKGRMGSRDARCYLASPEVVAASAIAGRITGGESGWPEGEVTYRFEPLATDSRRDDNERVSIVNGFPHLVQGRLVFVPQDNLNTDGIYGKDYTYRDDMTPDQMARVVMANYDPTFVEQIAPGDVLVGGFNFGTGSSREQAATALKFAGIPLIIAGSYSQTYLRNAFNNGILCVTCPALVEELRDEVVQALIDGKKTIIPGAEVEVRFDTGVVTWQGERFRFSTLGEVPQSLIVKGGVENLIREKLGLAGGE